MKKKPNFEVRKFSCITSRIQFEHIHKNLEKKEKKLEQKKIEKTEM